MGKRIETKLVLTAVDQYSATVKGMSKVTGRFSDTVRTKLGEMQKLRGPIKLIGDFSKMRTTVAASAKDLDKARERVRQLKTQLTSAAKPTAALRREFDGARRAAGQMEERHRANMTALNGLKRGLTAAGVNVRDLAGDERRLVSSLDATTQGFERQIGKMQRLAAAQEKMAGARRLFDERMGRSANMAIAGMATRQVGRRVIGGVMSPVRKAVAFESAMADVRKVVDFTGPDDQRAMQNKILDMSTRIPMSAEGIAQIVAAGGQSGIAKDDLDTFAEKAAKIGVAFDISADTAGSAMAEIKTQLSATLDETGQLFDAMNHLSNNSAASAPKVLEFMRRAGDMGTGFGMSRTEAMAMGSAMIAGGAAPEVAYTSFKNAGQALVRGKSATKTQKTAFKAIGLNSVDVAKRMMVDGTGTMIDVIERLNKLPDYMRKSVQSDLFGNEAQGLNMLIANTDLFREALALVADETDYAGSAQKEYETRSKTTVNALELMNNQLSVIGILLGDALLPGLNDLLAITGKVAKRFADWAKDHPRLTRAIAMGTVALGAAAVAAGSLLALAAGAIATLAMFRFGLTGIGIKAGLAASGLRGLGGAVPNFGPAISGAQAFSSGMAREMEAAALAAERTRTRINAATRAIRWKGVMSSILMAEAASRIPTDPTEVAAFMAANGEDFKAKMGWAMGNLPGLKQLVEAQNKLRGLFGLDPMDGTPGAGMGKVTEDLGAVEAGADSAAESADGLKGSLDAVGETVVAPKIDTLSIDEAAAAVRALSQQYQSIANVGHTRPPARGKGRGEQRRASGGQYGPGPVIVGERGPEAWFASRSGFIANNRQLLAMARHASVAATIGAALPAAAAGHGGGMRPAVGTLNITIPIAMPAGSNAADVVDTVRHDLGREIAAMFGGSFSD
ncbi:phage tail tape measure protein [Tropicimonas sp. IMCC34043]|uniref:phage tail tape measure protein n=1 Tax=Tropicimonas sp. IMCC34043 TaxID=2248760 RepID=UPI000E21CE6B|nr:phage tail tape measure protein [Tropicimonas sp. IMCC34043]